MTSVSKIHSDVHEFFHIEMRTFRKNKMPQRKMELAVVNKRSRQMGKAAKRGLCELDRNHDAIRRRRTQFSTPISCILTTFHWILTAFFFCFFFCVFRVQFVAIMLYSPNALVFLSPLDVIYLVTSKWIKYFQCS